MKMKNLLNSLTRLACAIILVGLSLSSFAQSNGFNYQAAIDPSITSDVTIEWTVGTNTGTVVATPTEGIISAVICEGVDFSELNQPTLEITLYAEGEVIATSSQVINAVPYADKATNAVEAQVAINAMTADYADEAGYAAEAAHALTADVANNVYINSNGELVVNGVVIEFNLPTSPTFTNINVTNQAIFSGNGPALIGDFGVDQWSVESSSASIATKGGIYAAGTSFFNGTLGAQSFKIYNTTFTDANTILGIDDDYPLNAGQPLEQYIPSYAALEAFKASLDDVDTVQFAWRAGNADEAAHALAADNADEAAHALAADNADEAAHALAADNAAFAEEAAHAANANHAIIADTALYFRMPNTATFTNITVNNKETVLGTGDAEVTDTDADASNASIATDGGIYAGGNNYFSGRTSLHTLQIWNAMTPSSLILGFDEDYPLDPGKGLLNYVPTYAALNEMYDVLYDDVYGDIMDEIDALSDIYLPIDPWQAIIEGNTADIADLQDDVTFIYDDLDIIHGTLTDYGTRIGDLEDSVEQLLVWDAQGLQHAYEMGREINTTPTTKADYAPIYIQGPMGIMSRATGADDIDLYALVGGLDADVFGVLGARVSDRQWAGYFVGDVNISNELYVGGEAHFGDAEFYDLHVTHDASISNNLSANNATFGTIDATTGAFGSIEANNAEYNAEYTNMITVGQYHGAPLAMQGTAEGGFDFYRPVRFHDLVTFHNLTADSIVADYANIDKVITEDLTFGNAYGDSIDANYIFADKIASDLFEGGDINANNVAADAVEATTGEFDVLSVRNMQLEDTIKDASEFTKEVLKVQLRDEVTDIYTVQALLGASTDEFAAYGVDHITSAVVGHNNLDGVGSLGSVLFDVTNDELITAFDLTSGDNLVLAGFFYGDVAVTGKLAADRLISHTALFQTTAVDEMEYKMVDADYTVQIGGDVTGFTGILGGTAPTGYGWTSAHAAVTGYEKLAADPSVKNGIGTLGAKIYGLTEELVCGPWDVASGDNKVFAGFFVGDVHVQGKLAVCQDAGTATTAWTTNTTFKAATGRIYKAFQGAATPASGITTEWEQTEAAIATDIPSLEVITGLSTIVYNISTTGKLYQAFGPAGWNSLKDYNGDGELNDKAFAGFFVGDVAINGNLAVNGNVKINGTLDTTESGISIPYYPATLGLHYVTELNADYPPSQEGQICVAYLTSTGKNVMYIAYYNGLVLEWNAVAGTSK